MSASDQDHCLSCTTHCLWLPVVAGAYLFPSRTSTLEISERLRQFEWLNDDSLLLLVISNLGVSGQREILPERVSIESIIGHDSPQVRVAGEEDTKEVVDFTLVPVCAIVEGCDGGYRRCLVGVALDADARVVADRKHVVNDLKALVACGIVDCGDVADLGELGSGVILQEVEDGKNSLWRDVDDQLVLPDGEPRAQCQTKDASTLSGNLVHTAGSIWAGLRAGTGRIGAWPLLCPGTCPRG